MAFPAGTDTRVLVVLELQLTADFYQEVGEQLQRISDGAGAPGEAAVVDLLDRCETAIESLGTAQLSTDAAIKRVDVIEFRDAGSVVGFANEVARLRHALVRMLGLEKLMAWMLKQSGGSKYSVSYRRACPPMERYL